MREIVKATEAPFRHAWQLVNKYLEVCPDSVWATRNGGYPVWQQMLHAIWVLDFFVCGEGEAMLPCPCDPETMLFKKPAEGVVSRKDVLDYAQKVIVKVDAWIAKLADEDLAKKNEVVSAKLGKEMTMASTFIAMTAHTQYHIGSCDSALRDNGLEGVY